MSAHPDARVLDVYDPGAFVRARDSFVLRAARDHRDGRVVTLLVPGVRADRTRFAAIVRAVAEAHAELSHPRIPRVLAWSDDLRAPGLAFDCAARFDGLALAERLHAGPPVPYAAADGFLASLREAMEASHVCTDPTTGGPRCMGRLSLANVLFDVDGMWHLVGFGRNFPIEDEHGRVDASVPSFAAPELAVGASASPVGDFVAMRLMMQSLLAYVDGPAAILRILRGELGPDDGPLLEALMWFEHEVMVQMPPRRPSMREIVAMSDRVRDILGIQRAPEVFAAYVRDAYASWAAAARPRLRVSPDGACVRLPDGSERRFTGASRRIVTALVEAHARGPDCALTVWDLIAAGWPDERVRAESATNRAYVTVNRIRAAGLQSFIERVDAGYRLAPALMVDPLDEAQP